MQTPYDDTEVTCNWLLSFPPWMEMPYAKESMRRTNLFYFYTLGLVVSQLQLTGGTLRTSGSISSVDWMALERAREWLNVAKISKILPRTAAVAERLQDMIEPILANPNREKQQLSHEQGIALHQSVIAFNNVLESESGEIFLFFVAEVAAYSTAALVENAQSHLSQEAQDFLTRDEIIDFKRAGECLAFGLYTASGFHAMRALEAEARRYHMSITGAATAVDWTLGPLINGNSGKNQFGMRDQWNKEGSRTDSSLVLIMSLLTTISQIYRNPIMHPEMTLNFESAKQVFNISSIAINAMVEDRLARGRGKTAKAVTP